MRRRTGDPYSSPAPQVSARAAAGGRGGPIGRGKGGRGTNENTNGLVRQYLPKGTDLTAYSHREVAAIQSSLNDRPRKRLDYLTPREVLTKNAARRRVAFGD